MLTGQTRRDSSAEFRRTCACRRSISSSSWLSCDACSVQANPRANPRSAIKLAGGNCPRCNSDCTLTSRLSSSSSPRSESSSSSRTTGLTTPSSPEPELERERPDGSSPSAKRGSTSSSSMPPRRRCLLRTALAPASSQRHASFPHPPPANHTQPCLPRSTASAHSQPTNSYSSSSSSSSSSSRSSGTNCHPKCHGRRPARGHGRGTPGTAAGGTQILMPVP